MMAVEYFDPDELVICGTCRSPAEYLGHSEARASELYRCPKCGHIGTPEEVES